MTVASLESRWSRALDRVVDRRDLLLPGVLLVLQYGLSAGTAHRHGSHAHLDALGWVLLAVGPLALTAVRRHPVAVLWVCFAATLSPHGGRFAYLSLIVSFFLAATRGHRWAAWSAIAIGYSTLWLVPLVYGQAQPTLQASVILASWLAVLVVVAEVVRTRQERTATAAAARHLDEQHRASRQRLSTARDLHDVIGHHISLIAVQAGVGLDLMDSDPEQARASLRTIRDVSREALDELRSMLAALRQEDDEAPRAPAPGLSRLEALVDSTRRLGIAVTTRVTGTVTALPASVDLAAYRIVQESLTNVARHANASRATVVLRYDQEAFALDVCDDGRGGPTDAASRGSGITGMRERAEALGGSLDAGPTSGGGFRVRATLPLRAT
ncbi:MAG TPA: sensor histidine kinase [Mycobacteriales bacterium]|nr:sensor histidine kinase [Mycobacteriales bacterium]